MGVGIALKREGAAQGLKYWINSATGEDPLVIRKPNGIDIEWKPGQAEKMVQYFMDLGKEKPGADPDKSLNVSVPMTQVIVPFIIRKYGLYVLGYTAAVVLASRYLGR